VIFSVRPPRKSWKQIGHLSGGEKTLSSLALVFALHHYRPTPLYVMDEIDAALDFKNVSIVGNYIKERTRNAQFIVISLRNNMFELADRLVGAAADRAARRARPPRRLHLRRSPPPDRLPLPRAPRAPGRHLQDGQLHQVRVHQPGIAGLGARRLGGGVSLRAVSRTHAQCGWRRRERRPPPGATPRNRAAECHAASG
jgi:energy-coupling factor transporter ATP-binding protein EcfA2